MTTSTIRYQTSAGPRYGRLEGQTVYELLDAPWRGGTDSGVSGALDAAHLLPPVQPRKILATAVNYQSHAIKRAAPSKPEIFHKPVSCVIGPEETVVLPYDAGRVDAEGELVVVIGRSARRVSAADALDHVAGFTAGFDISAREWQRSDRFFWRAKGADTFGPIGPAVVSQVDLASGQLVTRVNGEVRQQASLGELIFGVAELISFTSQSMTLEAGDLIFTGTPSVTPQIEDGDRIDLEIEGVPVLTNHVRREEAPSGVVVQEGSVDRTEQKLHAMGLELPPPRKPSVANIEKAVRTGSLLFVSGHGPYTKDGLLAKGKVGQDITVDDAYELAKHCALGGLLAAKNALGSLDKIRRVVKLLVLINATPDLHEQPKIANGASDLLNALFGEAGRHARSAIGVASVPNNMPLEIEMILEVE